MNRKGIYLMILMTLAGSAVVRSQDVERPRPAEWNDLVEGGRFMDRFLPMTNMQSQSKDAAWGAPGVRNRYIDNGIEVDNLSIWGGNILRNDDGKYHLFVCGWNESASKGHMSWWDSTVFHATGDSLAGPYRLHGTVGRGHNPEAFRLDDGRTVVYVIDGYYISDKVHDDIWVYDKFSFDARGRKIIDGLSNLTFARRKDGSRLMVCRGGGVWVSRNGLSVYRQISDGSIYPDVDGDFEDPVLWRDSVQYNLIVNDWRGRIAFYMRSPDGIEWITEPGEAYVPGIARHGDGTVEEWYKFERPKVFQDEHGRAVQMNFAVIDTLKYCDLPYDHHSSKNITIPLNKGLLLEILNKGRIGTSVKGIDVRIRAEEGFDPNSDINVGSLRFGSYSEVNFGRGGKAVRTRKDGQDLIVTFDGRNSGVDEREFAPKLIGRKKDGSMVFGYAKMPGYRYDRPVLSANIIAGDGADVDTVAEIENFGLSRSDTVMAAVSLNGKVIREITVPALQPYEKMTFTLPSVGNDDLYSISFKNTCNYEKN